MKIPSFIINIFLKSYLGEEAMNKIKEALSGKKTYLVAAGMIIAALVEYTGDGDLGKLINKIIEAIALITVRAGIAKAEVK
jgi:hypothetical protein